MIARDSGLDSEDLNNIAQLDELHDYKLQRSCLAKLIG
jgi:hypothetical protein